MNDTFRDMHHRPRSGNEHRDHHAFVILYFIIKELKKRN